MGREGPFTSIARPHSVSVKAFVGYVGRGSTDELDWETSLQKNRFLRDAATMKIGAGILTVLTQEPTDSLQGHERMLILSGRPFLGNELPWDRDPPASIDVSELDGKFAGVLMEPSRLILFTDCLGAGSVFYVSRAGRTWFSSHLGILLEFIPWQPRLRDESVAALLLARSQVFDETHFSGIYRLPAGKYLIAEGGESEIAGAEWWRSLLDLDAPEFGPGTFWDMMDHSVRREAYSEESLLMYSGGRDSTAIALADSEHPQTSATYGESYSTDLVRGRLRAHRLGLRSLRVEYGEWTLETYLDEIVGLHAGCSGLQTSHNIRGFDWASDRASLAAVGFLGDALTGAHSGPDCAPTDSYVLHILMPSHRDPLVSEIFRHEKEALEQCVMDAFSTLANEIGRRRALMILDLQWRQARWISMMFDLCAWFLPVSYPFMHRRMIASCLQASDESLSAQRDYDRALAMRARLGGRRNRPLKSRWEGPAVRFWTAIVARLRGRRPVGRCDWPAVMERTDFDVANYMCGHQRLDEVTQRSWSQWLEDEGRRRSNIPTAFASATVASALIRSDPNRRTVG